MDDERQEQGGGGEEPSGVRVRVALERPDWTGHGLTEITADDVLAAQQWDERCWRR